MHIRQERPEDREAISRLHYGAFKDHPQHQPGAEPVEHLIVERLREANALTLSLVAEEADRLVGHIALSAATIGAQAGRWYLLGPVGVGPAQQGRGTGSALIGEAIAAMQRQGADGIVLVGAPDFYGRFGFRSREGVTYPGAPQEFVLALPFTEPVPTGDVVAHAAFAAPGDPPD